MTMFISSTSTYSDWIVMSKTKKTYFLKTFLVLFMFIFYSCGTGIGNPGALIDPKPLPYVPAADANQYPSCGNFDETNSNTEIEAGRDCIREALSTCTAKIYFLDKTYGENLFFTSYVKVSPECTLVVHTASNDPNLFVGNETATCTSLAPTQIPELGCTIAD